MEYNKRSVNETTLLWNDLAMSLVFGEYVILWNPSPMSHWSV